MTLSLSRVLADAMALWRRDRDLLVRIALPFILLPSLALQLLVPPPLAAPAGTGLADAFRLQSQFAGQHALAYLLAAGTIEYGHAGLVAFYVDRRATDIRGVLGRAAAAWPRFVLLGIMIEFATLGGVLFFVAGRLLPAGAALIAHPRRGTIAAARRTLRLTAGETLSVSALAAGLIAARLLLLWPFAAMDGWLRTLSAPNPVALAIVDAAGAGTTMLVTIAGVLIAVVLYRTLAGEGGDASIGT